MHGVCCLTFYCVTRPRDVHQTLSGTGACRVVGDLFARFRGNGSPIYLPNPTWGNHIAIFENSGLEVRKYRYYDPKTVGLDFEGGVSYPKSVPTILGRSCTSE